MTRAWPPLRVALLIVAVLVSPACLLTAADEAAPLKRLADIELPRDADLIADLVPARTTLSGLLEARAVVTEDIRALIQAIRPHFNPRRFRAGQPYQLDRLVDGRIRTFEYEIDRDQLLRATRRADADTAFDVELAAIPKRTDLITVAGGIDRDRPTLIQALETTGEHLELSLALADVFSGEIDFSSEIQVGDEFRVVVERTSRLDGAFAGYGPVLAAEFLNDGRRLRAVRYVSPDGKSGYYDDQGRSLRRFFLKSPLKFEPRITSSFSRARRHPILKYTRAHNGVDYGAPTGAPVVSVASGVVTFAGWSGGGGRTVKVRHASGYESAYLHLSSIARGIRKGARVSQGEIVGRVGSSGLATGPHLHYGLKRDGRWVNPVREHRNMPPGDPIPAALRNAFSLERDRLFGLLFQSPTRSAND